MMRREDTLHAWWSRLRHQGLLLSPVVMVDRFSAMPADLSWQKNQTLRDAYTRFRAQTAPADANAKARLEERPVLEWVDALFGACLGHQNERLSKSNDIPEYLRAVVRIGNRTESLRPHRVLFSDETKSRAALLIAADTSAQVGRGRGRNTYTRFLELLRSTGSRLGLLTNGSQFRLVYAGLDFESWCEWEAERWFEDEDGSDELAGLRLLLAPDSVKPGDTGSPFLLEAIEESRKRQADLSSVLRENVRQAIEFLMEEVSAENRANAALLEPVRVGAHAPLSDCEVLDALYQAGVRVVMRLAVCLFAESRGLLPVNDPVFAQSYGVRSLYELLEEGVRDEGGAHNLFNAHSAWPRLTALFRLIHSGSPHGGLTLRAYGGTLFRPGRADDSDPVSRALYVLEQSLPVSDATVRDVLRKLLRGPLPVVRGRQKTFVEGPVDYTQLRTEFIGLIYQGLLDYRLKRADEGEGPQVFLNIGREPVLPLVRLETMLHHDPKGLKDLLTKLRKEQVTATVSSGEEEEEVDGESGIVDSEEEEVDGNENEVDGELCIVDGEQDANQPLSTNRQPPVTTDSWQRALDWARKAVVLAGLAPKQKKNETDREHQKRTDEEAKRLIKHVVATGEFYLVRAGNTRKGTGTFYTRPQLAVPTVHRTLEPLCYVVDSGSCVVDSEEKGKVDGSDELRGTGGVATSHGSGNVGISGDPKVPQRGSLRTDQSTPAGSGVSSLEHRRGTGAPLDKGVSQPSLHSQGLADGSAHPIGNLETAELFQSGDPSRDTSTLRNSSQTTERSDSGPECEALTTTHHPPTTNSSSPYTNHHPPTTNSSSPYTNHQPPSTKFPRTPEQILALKVCDTSCGSGSFDVAALHYLTDALYAALCYHCGLDDPQRSKTITLPYGRPRTGAADEEIVPFPPDDPQRGDQFEDRVKALLRRHVVERCIYGVDINPLAVEFARVSLWIETLDQDLPFTFLDHKIKVGNSLVGCWLDRVMDYPLKAWEREGGDGKDGERTQRIEEFLKGPRIGGQGSVTSGQKEKEGSSPATGHRPPTTGRRSGDGIIKQEMRSLIEQRFRGQMPLFEDDTVDIVHVVEQAQADYEQLHQMALHNPEARERFYREHIQSSPAVQRLKRAMDEWCAVWFWPMDEESAKHAPTPKTFHSGRGSAASDQKDTILDRVVAEQRFFHWELEFPDVFLPSSPSTIHQPPTNNSSPSTIHQPPATASPSSPATDHRPLTTGFDATFGNPPWEVMKPNSQEFFTEYDPVYRTYDKQAALRRQRELFAMDPGIRDKWDEYCSGFKALSNWVQNVAEPFEMALAKGNTGKALAELWTIHRNKVAGDLWSVTGKEPSTASSSPAPDPRPQATASSPSTNHQPPSTNSSPSTIHPFQFQGSADLNSYKLFLELDFSLLAANGRMGLIVPSGLYTDSGSGSLRELFLEHATWDWLFSFENRKKIFDIHGSFKFASVIIEKSNVAQSPPAGNKNQPPTASHQPPTSDHRPPPTHFQPPSTIHHTPIKAAFMAHDLDAWDRPDPPVFTLDRGLIPLFSPRSKSIPEVRTGRDLEICRKIYEHSIRIGDRVPGWEIEYAREFDMTNDSKLFKPREWWEAKGYHPDPFGRWVNTDGDVALPLYEGRMIGQFDFSQKGWVSGKGRTAVWRDVPFDTKTIEPQYLMSASSFRKAVDSENMFNITFMDVTAATNSRTMITVACHLVPFGNSAPVLRTTGDDITSPLLLSVALNSLVFDFCARQRTGGNHLNWFIVDELPLPRFEHESTPNHHTVLSAARLTFIHRRFAPEWLRLRRLYPELCAREWKHWWAVTEADRLRLRVEIDALCADLYGLDPDDFDWIVRNDPSDPKGFWRVDKQLPYEQRLTGLASRAFRALKSGQWTVPSCLNDGTGHQPPVTDHHSPSTSHQPLTNDQFFELLDIPELTSESAARKKGHDRPLIYNRDGCHRWQPELFPEDDPRHGWTWDDCYNDAVSLLGSEEAVRDYLETNSKKAEEVKRRSDEPNEFLF